MSDTREAILRANEEHELNLPSEADWLWDNAGVLIPLSDHMIRVQLYSYVLFNDRAVWLLGPDGEEASPPKIVDLRTDELGWVLLGLVHQVCPPPPPRPAPVSRYEHILGGD